MAINCSQVLNNPFFIPHRPLKKVSFSAQHPSSEQPGGSVKRLLVKDQLKAVSPEEQRLLIKFFRSMIQEDSVGYTLLNAKPMAMGHGVPDGWTGGCFSGKDIDAGWPVWQKYRDLFPHDGFLIRRASNPVYDEPNQYCLLFINKSLALKKIQQHLELFQSTTGTRLSARELLIALEKDSPVSQAILDNEITMGVLLGYGKISATWFNRFCELKQSYDSQNKKWIAKPDISPQPGFTSPQEELEAIEKANDEGDRIKKRLMNDYNISYSPDTVNLPGFRIWPTDLEAIDFLNQAAKVHKAVNNLFVSPTLLEDVLTIMADSKAPKTLSLTA